MHDVFGQPLKEGDIVLIPAVVTELQSSSDDYCNVSLRSLLGRRPDGVYESFQALNTGVLVRANPGDTLYGSHNTPSQLLDAVDRHPNVGKKVKKQVNGED